MARGYGGGKASSDGYGARDDRRAVVTTTTEPNVQGRGCSAVWPGVQMRWKLRPASHMSVGAVRAFSMGFRSKFGNNSCTLGGGPAWNGNTNAKGIGMEIPILKGFRIPKG